MNYIPCNHCGGPTMTDPDDRKMLICLDEDCGQTQHADPDLQEQADLENDEARLNEYVEEVINSNFA